MLNKEQLLKQYDNINNENKSYISNIKEIAIEKVFNESASKTISLEKLNKFVEVHHKIIHAPQPNYERIRDTAELKISHDSRMAVMIEEQNKLLRENNYLQNEILKKNIRVENKIDRDGVSSMVWDYIDQKRKDRRT